MSKWIEPTEEQQAHCELVQQDLIETMNRLGREGIDPRIILAGAGAAIADLVTSTFSASAVVPWFESQAKIARELQRPG